MFFEIGLLCPLCFVELASKGVEEGDFWYTRTLMQILERNEKYQENEHRERYNLIFSSVKKLLKKTLKEWRGDSVDEEILDQI